MPKVTYDKELKNHTLQARVGNTVNNKFNQIKEVYNTKETTYMITTLIEEKHANLGLEAINSEAELSNAIGYDKSLLANLSIKGEK